MSSQPLRLSDVIKITICGGSYPPDIDKVKSISDFMRMNVEAPLGLSEQSMLLMKKYKHKELTEVQMLCLLEIIDYTVKHQSVFRIEVGELEFIRHMQILAKFKKEDVLDEVQMKARKMIAEWGFKFPYELNEYMKIYEKNKKAFNCLDIQMNYPQLIENSEQIEFEKYVHKIQKSIKKCSVQMISPNEQFESVLEEAKKLSKKFEELIEGINGFKKNEYSDLLNILNDKRHRLNEMKKVKPSSQHGYLSLNDIEPKISKTKQNSHHHHKQRKESAPFIDIKPIQQNEHQQKQSSQESMNIYSIPDPKTPRETSSHFVPVPTSKDNVPMYCVETEIKEPHLHKIQLAAPPRKRAMSASAQALPYLGSRNQNVSLL
ncbi:hypothetical protein EHI8A_037190 [Entamoeba histolytica HM-1:IMSS-B]|uniref:VHS domain-containing protein n=6 Tax=Entamoeba histolytica TaxID=5759 RepID=C4M201_ENTH1|nr:hypothetical protein EHI_165200 [Entamoeba histolytica HM-1:IMSS]EMD42410.1 Hypothetical protein EHI5A_069530 [Entamoeba histolytica KU27]EMH77754.1 hypothetical protein EHI8A_037190 [Entamoeba histolytica HM-1:IMSS-B]EMS12355.1 hypothetical protein KM1_080600 [Entamoeba histolytica HM-3:IMSS]ENY60121.1 hypothetical protein EHI7A_038240 [Entamoeba histolytica HM-1:IMSS-A]GAT95275.1 hypothetical protein CL6EHI_165200 [Entamoeba histolytica]|eukprot:XP_652230.2 hypothetical protein EHI_165200 [Entamoeba histolytica HM-1:IMSS]